MTDAAQESSARSSFDSSWVVLITGAFGRWLGWWAVIAGLGLVVARFVWTSEFWIAPYALFWIWAIIVSIQLVRGQVH